MQLQVRWKIPYLFVIYFQMSSEGRSKEWEAIVLPKGKK